MTERIIKPYNLFPLRESSVNRAFRLIDVNVDESERQEMVFETGENFMERDEDFFWGLTFRYMTIREVISKSDPDMTPKSLEDLVRVDAPEYNYTMGVLVGYEAMTAEAEVQRGILPKMTSASFNRWAQDDEQKLISDVRYLAGLVDEFNDYETFRRIEVSDRLNRYRSGAVSAFMRSEPFLENAINKHFGESGEDHPELLLPVFGRGIQNVCSVMKYIEI